MKTKNDLFGKSWKEKEMLKQKKRTERMCPWIIETFVQNKKSISTKFYLLLVLHGDGQPL